MSKFKQYTIPGVDQRTQFGSNDVDSTLFEFDRQLQIGKTRGATFIDPNTGLTVNTPITLAAEQVDYSATISLDVEKQPVHIINATSSNSTINATFPGKEGQEITLLITAGAGEITYPASSNIQGHWKFDEVSGARSDSSGNGNTLTDNNTVSSTTDKQEGSRAADFELSNSEYLSITDGAQTGLDITGDLSIFAWVNVESAPSSAGRTIVSKEKATGGDDFAYTFSYKDDAGTDKLSVRISSDGTSSTEKTVDFDAGTATWVHVGMVYDASAGEADFYTDGTAEGATQTGLPTSINNSAANFLVGAFDSASPGSFWDGYIDDLVVWNTELTAANASALYDEYGTSTVTFSDNFKPNGTLATTAGKTAIVKFLSDGTFWHEVSRTTGL